jgi:hypothetical protein
MTGLLSISVEYEKPGAVAGLVMKDGRVRQIAGSRLSSRAISAMPSSAA